jgi:hypothetical protein
LTLILAGCANVDVAGLFLAQKTGANGDRVVAGSLEAVATSTQASLSSLGLHAVSTRKGEAIHITSTTKNGASFTLILTRDQTRAGEQTRIRLEWGNGRDDEAGVQILSEVSKAPRMPAQ